MWSKEEHVLKVFPLESSHPGRGRTEEMTTPIWDTRARDTERERGIQYSGAYHAIEERMITSPPLPLLRFFSRK